MRVTRCHVPLPLRTGATLTLPAAAAAHVARVLRLRPGAALTLFDGAGGEYEAIILDSGRDGVRVSVGAHRPVEREARIAVTLLQALPRGERMDWMVQKATELGAAAIVPVISDHSVVQLDAAARERKRGHWQAVAIGACEQCGRNRLPHIQAAVEFEQACAQAADAARSAAAGTSAAAAALLMLAPAATGTLSTALAGCANVTLLIGPEGGFSERELAIARHHGFQACSLGTRVLRTETAPVAALAAIAALSGEFA